MKLEQFAEKVKVAYNKYFNGSFCNVHIFNCLGKSLWIDCYLANGKEEMINGYKENDMFHISFEQYLPDNFDAEKDDLPEIMELMAIKKGYLVKPENKYMFCSHKSISYKRTKTDAEKSIQKLDMFFQKFHDAILKDIAENNIHGDYQELLNKRIIK